MHTSKRTNETCYERDGSEDQLVQGRSIKRPAMLFSPEGIPLVQPAPKRPRPSIAVGDHDSICAFALTEVQLPVEEQAFLGEDNKDFAAENSNITADNTAEVKLNAAALPSDEHDAQDQTNKGNINDNNTNAPHCPRLPTETSMLADHIKDTFVVSDDSDYSDDDENHSTTACESNPSPDCSAKISDHPERSDNDAVNQGKEDRSNGCNAVNDGCNERFECPPEEIESQQNMDSGGGDNVEKEEEAEDEGDTNYADSTGDNNNDDDGDSGDNTNNDNDNDNAGEEEEDDYDEDDEYVDETFDCDIEGSQEEIEELERLIPDLSEKYRLLGKIGHGTFSTVYKAIDLHHERYDNSSWTMIFNSDSSGQEVGTSNEGAAKNSDDAASASASASASGDEQLQHGDCKRRRTDSTFQRRSRVVAIKKIYVTSTPKRIINEISILNDLKGSRYIAPLVTAMRKNEQVIVVLPYFRNDDFRRFYLDLPIEEIRWYFASLLNGLKYMHSKGVMHRDIKPSNFLYDVSQRHGVLVDFGLAERESDQEATRMRSKRSLQMDSSTAMRLFRSFDQKGRPGVPRKDTRPGLRANRAGTRGFRAPEVLFKVPQQSVSIDIWSVGVILLCFLTRRFPFFLSVDDTEALLEIAVLYGRLEMERVAADLGRTFLTNIPTVKDRGIRFESLAKAYNTEGYPYLPPDAFDLLRRMLTLKPENRITAVEALEHPFIKNRNLHTKPTASP
ncbi:Cell division control protein 7 [Coemansia sp. RSA 1358]|nr:Cell division control protein 7 [Coemansia sp. RSA 1358]